MDYTTTYTRYDNGELSVSEFLTYALEQGKIVEAIAVLHEQENEKAEAMWKRIEAERV